jgi:nicotinamidase/pyrazinamidase
MANTVLVVDMLRGFLEEGHNLYCGPDSRAIIPNIQRLLRQEQEAGSTILFISDHHDPDDLEFEIFPVHCVKGTAETEVIPELQEWVEELNIIPKNRYSGFFNTELEARLKNLKPDKLVVCGVCTDICVMHTISDARNRDYPVVVPTDCVASFDPEAHKWALDHTKKILGASLIESATAG